MTHRPTSAAKPRTGAWLMFAIVVLGLLLGTVAAALIARRVDENHLVSGRILLQIGRELGSARPTMVGENASVQANPRREDVNTEAEMLGSPALIESCFRELVAEKVLELKEPSGFTAMLRSVSDGLGLTTPKSVEARTLEKWSQSLTIYAVAGSNVLGIECRTSDPESGKALLDRMITHYLDAHLKAYSTSSSEPFFHAEVARLETKLLDCESTLSKHRLETRVYDADTEKGLALSRRGEAEAGKRTLEARLAAARARVGDLEKSLHERPDAIVIQSERKASPIHDELEKRHADAVRAFGEIEAQYPESSPYVTRARSMVEQTAKMLATAPKERDESTVLGPSQIHIVLAQELAKASAELKALEAELVVARASVVAWDQRLVEIETTRIKFSSMIVALGEAQRDLSQALGTARLSRISKQLDDLQVANVNVIVPPTIHPTPIRTFGLPTRIAITAQGALLGLVLGLAAAFILHARRERDRAAAATGSVGPAWQEHEGLA